LCVLLLVRAFLLREIGSPLGWVFHLDLAVVSVPFSADQLPRMLLYSPLSFLKTVFMFHAVLAAVSCIARPVPAGGTAGWMFRRLSLAGEGWPGWVLWPAWSLAGALLWMGASVPLQAAGLIPDVPSGERLVQAALIGGAVGRLWLWTLAALLLLAVVNRHLYLGAHPLWAWTGAVSAGSLRWAAWIPARFGGLDLRPLAGACLAVAFSALLQRLLEWR
jgi:hypothetical protein